MTVLVVTGTGTGVGKTIVTAAIATLAADRGSSVAVVKPAQTGLRAYEAGDLDDVRRLSGVTDLHELIRYPDPLSPAAAARRAGMRTLDLRDVAKSVSELAETRRLVLVEGAGGLLVWFDEEGWTLADLAVALGAPAVVVTSAGLGSLNTTALTLEAMAHRGVDLAGLVIGDWPTVPDLASRSNVRDLEMLAARPLAGAIREHVGRHPRPEFLGEASAGLGPTFGGRFDPGRFRVAAEPWQPVELRRTGLTDVQLSVTDPDVLAPEPVPVTDAVLSDDGLVLSLRGQRRQHARIADVAVREDASAVFVTVRAGTPATLADTQYFVQDQAVGYCVEVQLDRPLGERHLFSA